MNEKLLINDSVAAGLDKYVKIMTEFKDCDVSINIEFQKLFKGFYKLRQKNSQFYDTYFSFMEAHRQQEPTFEETLRFLFEKTGEIHYSFASKLIHTINPHKPILDQYVMRWMGYSLLDRSKERDSERRIDYYVNAYKDIEKQYLDIQKESYMKNAIYKFDALHPEFKAITNEKKIDCFLIGLGDKTMPSILEYFKLRFKET